MAKSKSFFGLRRGSTKSHTFSVLDGQQITKERVTSVKNPKTAGQSAQRMKLAPAQQFYGALNDVLDHSFQGVQYGEKSRQRFMSLAMKQNGGPYVIKDYKQLVPGSYTVSTGNLAPVLLSDYTDNDSVKTSLSTFYTTKASFDEASRAEIVKSIINGNLGFELSDKISFLFIIHNSTTDTYHPYKLQIILEPTLTNESDNFDTIKSLGYVTDGDANGFLRLALDDADTMGLPEGSYPVALAVIHSRGAQSDSLRSNAAMAIGDHVKDRFYSDAAFRVALQSYATEGGVPVGDEWYLNNIAAGIVGRVVQKTVTFKLGNANRTVRYLSVIVDVAGVYREFVLVQAGDVLVDNEGFAASVTNAEGTGQVDVTLQMAGLTGSPKIAWKDEYLNLFLGSF